MDQHIKILGVASIAFHALQALIVLFVVPFFIGASLLADHTAVSGVLQLVGTILTIVILVLTLPGIIGGIGLLKYKPWSRILLLVSNTLFILSFPFGTALGAYTYWVLFKDETIAILEDSNGWN